MAPDDHDPDRPGVAEVFNAKLDEWFNALGVRPFRGRDPLDGCVRMWEGIDLHPAGTDPVHAFDQADAALRRVGSPSSEVKRPSPPPDQPAVQGIACPSAGTIAQPSCGWVVA
jgi:hypothetical protein